MDTLLGMRESLGWVVDIPRHGPDTREKMATLKDIPEDEKVSNLFLCMGVIQTLFLGVFYYQWYVLFVFCLNSSTQNLEILVKNFSVGYL